ncbi:MAG: hypothetical protein KC503_13845 [Myxococcales bacterium]|nr:hypothetical protein [Myxococcales bacterium]
MSMKLKVKLVVFLVIGVVAALIFVYQRFFSRAAKAKQALKQSVAVSLSEAIDNMVVKIVGRLELVDPANPLIGPLSERPCAHYALTVEQKSGKSSSTIIDEKQTQDFWLVDETGRALVQAEGAQILLTIDARRKSGTGKDAPPRLEKMLEERGKKSKGWVFNKNLRYREGALEPGETIAVMGLCRVQSDPQGGTRKVLTKPMDGDLIITDDVSLI